MFQRPLHPKVVYNSNMTTGGRGTFWATSILKGPSIQTAPGSQQGEGLPDFRTLPFFNGIDDKDQNIIY